MVISCMASLVALFQPSLFLSHCTYQHRDRPAPFSGQEPLPTHCNDAKLDMVQMKCRCGLFFHILCYDYVPGKEPGPGSWKLAKYEIVISQA